jgi:hypothetical protein
MIITFRSRPLTPAEAEAGWGGVLVSDLPPVEGVGASAQYRVGPVYVAHAADLPHFPESPMGQTLARVTGATIIVEA